MNMKFIQIKRLLKDFTPSINFNLSESEIRSLRTQSYRYYRLFFKVFLQVNI